MSKLKLNRKEINAVREAFNVMVLRVNEALDSEHISKVISGYNMARTVYLHAELILDNRDLFFKAGAIFDELEAGKGTGIGRLEAGLSHPALMQEEEKEGAADEGESDETSFPNIKSMIKMLQEMIEVAK